MKIALALCLFVSLASASNVCLSNGDCDENHYCLLGKSCVPRLLQYSQCNQDLQQCMPGLSCKLTKIIHMIGQEFPVKQCMPADEEISVEVVHLDESGNVLPPPQGRIILGKCTQESDCGWNQCCMFGKRCGLKLIKHSSCFFVHKHKCGCMDGHECKQTTTIMLPIVQVPFAIWQCVVKTEPQA